MIRLTALFQIPAQQTHFATAAALPTRLRLAGRPYSTPLQEHVRRGQLRHAGQLDGEFGIAVGIGIPVQDAVENLQLSSLAEGRGAGDEADERVVRDGGRICIDLAQIVSNDSPGGTPLPSDIAIL